MSARMLAWAYLSQVALGPCAPLIELVAAVGPEALPATGAIGVRELSEQSGQTMAAVRGALPILELDGLVGQDETGWFRCG